ncbi:hypothetical protein RchiOBHm_Chr2g0117801 [Rosa chinensis]|uniref:Uncharacterized protein n=1 Tax=Rosa chinensis TaxID=74649 RepID=A0A2P6RRK6_ROSCH|nr:hypothetical protein RchiOBHm_Chr2g0117801 [Rosa chinensis]
MEEDPRLGFEFLGAICSKLVTVASMLSSGDISDSYSSGLGSITDRLGFRSSHSLSNFLQCCDSIA